MKSSFRHRLFSFGLIARLFHVLAFSAPGDAWATPSPLDASFDPGRGPLYKASVQNTEVNTLALQSDGKILVRGAFDTFDGVSRPGLARILPNGSLDTAFVPQLPGAGTIQAVQTGSDEKIYVGGLFQLTNNSYYGGVCRLDTDGKLDPMFRFGKSARIGSTNIGNVFTLALEAKGTLLVGGYFDSYDDVSHPGLTRLNPDGSSDLGFVSKPVMSDEVFQVLALPSQKILVAGIFVGQATNSLTTTWRLNLDGTLDGDYQSSVWWSFPMLLQPDGKIVMAGLVRLNDNGSLDPTFHPPPAEGVIAALARQPNGQIVVAGGFSSFSGIPRPGVARLNADGALDLGV